MDEQCSIQIILIKKLDLKLAFNKLEKDKQEFFDVNRLSVYLSIVGQYDYSVTRFWYNFHGYPTEDKNISIIKKNL